MPRLEGCFRILHSTQRLSLQVREHPAYGDRPTIVRGEDVTFHDFHVTRLPRMRPADCHLIVGPNFEAGFVPQDASAQRNAPIPKNRCIYACQIARIRAARRRSPEPIGATQACYARDRK